MNYLPRFRRAKHALQMLLWMGVSPDGERIIRKALVIVVRRCSSTANGWVDEHLVAIIESICLVPDMCQSCVLKSVWVLLLTEAVMR